MKSKDDLNSEDCLCWDVTGKSAMAYMCSHWRELPTESTICSGQKSPPTKSWIGVWQWFLPTHQGQSLHLPLLWNSWLSTFLISLSLSSCSFTQVVTRQKWFVWWHLCRTITVPGTTFSLTPTKPVKTRCIVWRNPKRSSSSRQR